MTLKYTALGTFTLAIRGDATAPTLKNLASGANKIGDEIDLTGSSDRLLYAVWQLRVRGASAFVAGEVVELYFLPTPDGTNYTDGGDSVNPQKALLAFVFETRAVSTQLVLATPALVLPPVKFKPLVINTTARGFTDTDDENQLHYRPFSVEDV
ncbi:MAG TPA: hypothetical protein VGB64_08450 [Actinomycetota bacterium]